MGLDFRWLFESAPGRYVVLGPDWTILAATDAYVAFTRQSRETLIGRSFFDVVPGNPGHGVDDAKSLRSSLERVRLSKVKETLPIQRVDERYWSPSNTPLLDEGGELVAIVHAVDEVTHAIRDEHQRLVDSNNALASTNAELEAFCYSVAHDLRAPLRGIQGFSQALLEDYVTELDEKGQDYLQRVSTAALRMSDLIDDLLNLSRISRLPVSRVPVDLTAMAHEIVRELKHRCKHPVDAIIADGLHANADARLVRIVLENLLNNAFKFTTKTEGARVEFGVTQIDGGRTFFVRDNGAGFDEAYATNLFAPFQRLHADKEFGGTGVGLATVQRILRRHGGRAWAKGAVNRGATFYFTLPD